MLQLHLDVQRRYLCSFDPLATFGVTANVKSSSQSSPYPIAPSTPGGWMFPKGRFNH